jgi:hypothetical protein
MSLEAVSQAELIFLYIGESRVIKRISNEILLILHEDAKSINTIRMKELLQFKIRGRLSHLYHLAISTIREEAMYASALYTQLDSLLAILSLDDKVVAIKLITKICSAYRASKETIQSTAQISDSSEKMEIG